MSYNVLELNIGLYVGTGTELVCDSACILQAVHRATDHVVAVLPPGARVSVSLHVAKGTNEPTLAVHARLPVPLTRMLAESAAHSVAVRLDQEAVAYRCTDGAQVLAGLAGPKSREWGRFDPSLWITPVQSMRLGWSAEA